MGSKKIFTQSIRAFSLIELLVVMVVIAILMSLTLGLLSRSRKASQRTSCLARLSQCGRAFQAYTTDSREIFPIFASLTEEPAFSNGGLLGFYAQSFHWPLALRSYLNDSTLNEVALCPVRAQRIFSSLGPSRFMAQYPPGFVYMADFNYSLNFVVRPEAWVPETESVTDFEHRRPIRLSEVVFPSSKGLLLETHPSHRSPAAAINAQLDPADSPGVTFVDGAVSVERLSDLKTPRREGSYPVMSTLHGVRGLDK